MFLALALLLATADAAYLVPATVHENLLLVPVRVNGGPPRTFLLDTAAPTSYIDPHLTKAGPATLSIAGKRVRVPKLATLDLAFFEAISGKHLDGVIGMDVFQQFVVEMDYDAGLVRLHDPATFTPPPDVAAIPVTLVKNRPFVRVELKVAGHDAVTRDDLVDSGSGGALADPLFKSDGGEPIGPDLARAERFVLGPFRLEGINATSGDAKFGGELLHRFHVIADFPHQRLFLEPNRYFGDAWLFDTSGLELEQGRDGLVIAQVYARSPGAEAGLQKGDIITAIDGQSALVLGVDRVWKAFHSVRTHALVVRRGTRTLHVTLALRRML
ncbi:MAG: PDZ domain-containing protein [Acidobacteria bacterium]|nr:PDZ domain-containing protein [Acidobacteriota bacterium]MBV9475935.1 PDZ domain-containing protein [Acidobacteriota bacterium]